MGLSRRKFTREFKIAVLRGLEVGASIAEIARRCEINPNLLHRWRKVPACAGAIVPWHWEARIGGRPSSRTGKEDQPAIGGDRFFETMLAAHRRTAAAAGIEWKAALYQEVRQQMSIGQLAFYQMCALAGVSRKGFYRFDPERVTADRDIDPRDAIQRIALEMPSYGRLRITAELKRRGWTANHKRVQRIMREAREDTDPS